MIFERIKNLVKSIFIKEPLLELSYSKISAYLFCPFKYKLVYVYKQKVPPNPYISLGLSIHRALEEYHKNKGSQLEELIETYDHEWVNAGFQNPQQTFQFYEKGKRMLTEYFEFSLQRKAEIVAVEKEFKYSAGPYILRGIIDRIDRLPDGTYEIIDYKTHADIWDQSRIDSDLQLTLYSLGAKNALKIEPVTFSYFFLAHNKLMPTQRSKAQRQEALKELKNVFIKIKKQEFSPNTAQCPKCDFKQSCKYSTAKGIPANAK
ncbi:MAG: PD-(D/E)XK nuclease family protein [Elusimicrobia bacterium]|nr:PD-(D/E)XK nuclease family protein [Elusimicrobiota bacterium]